MSTTPRATDSEALLAQLAQLSPERRALVERALRERGFVLPAPVERIPRRMDAGPAPLTYNQELLWALDQAVPDLVAYNVPRVLRIRGTLDVAALQRALDALVVRHETLRTRFVAGADGPCQIIGAPERVPFECIDLRAMDDDARAASADRTVLERTRQRFDLAQDLMLRATLLQLQNDEWILLLLTHHIVCDEWSRDVTFRDLGALYRAERAGTDAGLQELPIQYADYAAWQRRAVEQGSLADGMRYWREELESPPTLELPTDRPRGPVPSFTGNRLRYSVPGDLLMSLRALARENDVTLHMVLLAAYNVVLARHSGQNDILVGSPISARRLVELEGLIGFFPNTLVLRTRLHDDPSFRDLLRRTRDTCLAAYDHAEIPLERLALDLREAGQLGVAPLFNVWFVTGAPQPTMLELDGATIQPQRTDFETAKFDLAFSASEDADELHVVLEYRTELFDAETIDRFFEHVRTVLEAVVADDTARVSELPLMRADERDLVVRTFNDTACEYDSDATLASLLSAQAARTPSVIAVADEQRSLTYAELDAASDVLARELVAAGAGRGSLVAVCVDRSVELVAALVAVVKAGAAYVPLDPQYPSDRLAFMMEDSAAPVLVASRDLASSIPALAASTARLVAVDDVWSRPAASDAAPLHGPAPEDLAYMIYTSGSTGVPKGALNTHRGIVNRLCWMQQRYGLTAADTVLQKTPASFDVSVWEFFWPLITGARLVLAAPGGHRDAAYLCALIQCARVTVLHFVPSMLRAFLAEPAVAELAGSCGTPGSSTPLRDVICSGEALAPELVAAFYRTFPTGVRLHNLYGPTECAVDVSHWPCPPSPEPPVVVPIGRPVANTQLYVLDAHCAPVPIGVAGELYIGGVQVGAGYWRRPELTAERFVPDPFRPSVSRARLYRTGDRARWRADGTLEYLGRLDQQVKLRGFRIELGEIENALAQEPDVQAAAVAAHDDASGGARLVGYVVPRADDAAASEAVERWAEVFDSAYARADETGDAVESGFNIAGWISSYDKRPLPAAEMREWVDTTCDRILALRPRRVLEVGCGTGLLLFRIAPHVERYHGIDVSRAALQSIASDPAFAPIADRVTLAHARADEIEAMEPGSFDTIVINSVVQYFPSADYLVRVLEAAARLLVPGGTIFVGDVRLRPLLDVLHGSIALHEAADDTSLADLRARVEQRMWNESELVVDPELFHALRSDIPSIADVDVLIKRGRVANELTKFRGDVILRTRTVEGEPARAMPDGVSASSLDEVRALLGTRPHVLRIADVADSRLGPDVAVHEAIVSAPAQSTVRELRARLADVPCSGLDPEALALLEPEYDATLAWPASGKAGRFDVVFLRRGVGPALGVGGDASPARAVHRPWADFAHHPAPEAFSLAQVDRWRASLQRRLPDYMIPSMFVRIDALPLTPSGKVDRKALHPPASARSARAYAAPRTPTEEAVAAIWAEVLRIDQVGMEDGFLDLGGHSLLAMRIVGRIRRDFGVNVQLDPLLRGHSVAQLAALVDELRAACTDRDDDDEFALAPVRRDAFVRTTSAPSGAGA